MIMSTRKGCRILPGIYQRRTAVWEGRGATARPWEAKWSSGVAAVCWSTKYITTKNMGFLELKKCFFKRGCFGCGGISCFFGTSVCVALIFERAGGASKPGPPLAARNRISALGTTPDEGSLL